MVVVVAMLTAVAVPVLSAHAAATWLAPATLSSAGSDAHESHFDVAMSSGGDTLAVWLRGGVLESSFRPAGGSFGPVVPVPFVPGATGASTPVVAFDGAVAVILFAQGTPSGTVVARALRAADGSFAETKVISGPGFSSGNPELASGAGGEIVAVWYEVKDAARNMVVSVRPPGGEFGLRTEYPVAGDFDYAIDANAAGDAIVAWDTGTSLHAASRPATGSFGAAAPVVTTGDDLATPSVALGDNGAAVVTFLRRDATVSGPNDSYGKGRAWATLRAAGSSAFAPPQDISANNFGTIFTGAAIDGKGDAVALFQAGTQPWAAVAPPGGSFGAPSRLSPASHDMYSPQIRVSGDGTTHVSWLGSGADGHHARHVVRPPGGGFADMQTLPGGPATGFYSKLAVDAQGNAAMLWRRAEGADDRVQVSGYDAAPPQLRSQAFSRSGFVGTALPFSVDAVDVWSPVSSVGWEFGDGATASGTQASHAYAAPGTYGASVTATDALGNTGIVTGTVTIAPAPVPVPGRPPGSTDRTVPVLSSLKLSPARFRAASRGASLAATAIGTTVRFTLSEAASVRFTAQRAAPGRRAGGSCRRTTAANRRRARCTRYVAVKGSATRRSVRGANRVKFRGRLGGRRLAPGKYRLILRATDVAGNRSPLRRVAFRIVAR